MTPPVATYRLQFRGGMTFDRAAGIVPYLRRLGVSHLYASPIFTAASGSTHGYDVTDFNEIDPALGGRAGFDRLSDALRMAGIGLLLDIVPNHMAASHENPWWRDAVEWGARAQHAAHFDIDWTRRLTLPFLGRPLRDTLAAGELRVGRDPRGLILAYYDMAWPLTPPSYAILSEAAPDHPALTEIAELAAAANPERAADFHRAMRSRLDRPDMPDLDAALGRLSDDRHLIERLHAAQPWQMTHWREARRDLSYRRFFEVTSLAGTRVEDPAVFADIHALTLELLREGRVQGLRVDHVDGLADPAAYLDRLRAATGPDTWIVVEKILEGDETLPANWPVAGTTGYEFAASVVDLLTPAEGAGAMEAAYLRLSGAPPAAQQLAEAKREMITCNFAGELSRVLALLAPSDSSQSEREALREALVDLLAALPVYRTYGDADGFSGADMQVLHAAAGASSPAAGAAAVERVIGLLAAPGAAEARVRFQQLSGPVMAKAVEDTLFYRHNAVLARNEVGNDPVHPPAEAEAVHAALAARQARRPFGLSATATHDTKRGEDARARLAALADAPERWIDGVEHWRALAAGKVRDGVPEPGTEWLIYQALAGAWPDTAEPPAGATLDDLRDRFSGYLLKALREAKLRTTWTEPDPEYEAAMLAYAEALLGPGNEHFRAHFHAALRPYCAAGRVASLAQTLVKLTAPGVPDIYQGTEGGDFAFVDPDNRREVDFGRLARLATTVPGWPAPLAEAKNGLLHTVLAERARRPRLYAEGDYRPLRLQGPRAAELFAFMRRFEESVAITLVPIRPARFSELTAEDMRRFWHNTYLHIPDHVGALRNLLTGEDAGPSRPLPVDRPLAQFPCALLTKLRAH